MNHLSAITLFSVSLFFTTHAYAFRILLEGGIFYGPGDKGEHVLQAGTLENYVAWSQQTGHIPFFNNGGDAPNVLAESLHTGPVDGLFSDGTPINENVNGAFLLQLQDPTSDTKTSLLVGSTSEELIFTDRQQNLVFSLNAAFDPGAGVIYSAPTEFVTGTVQIPFSMRTQQGLPGGQDQAGQIPSGRYLIGRLGDFNQDGFLDGKFVLGDNVPEAMPLTGGDPIFIERNFHSNIAVTPSQASLLIVNGIFENFMLPITETLNSGEYTVTTSYLTDIIERIDAALANIAIISQHSNKNSVQNSWIRQSIELLHGGRENIETAISAVNNNNGDIARQQITQAFDRFGATATLLFCSNGSSEIEAN